mgnify:FL=1
MLINDHYQNFKVYNIPRAQLVIADIPYNVRNKENTINVWYNLPHYYSDMGVHGMKKIDLTGQRFGKLVVLAEVESGGKNTAWLCLCDCGKKKRGVLTYNLTAGKSKSCGCVRGDKIGIFSRTHGESKTRLYQIYKGMKQRCGNKNNPAYQYYGGKGVSVSKCWAQDYLGFKKWAIENGYSKSGTIDRINPNGNYEPSNCRWVSLKKQQSNKLNSMFVTIGDDKLTIAEWADKNRTNKQTLYSAFYRLVEQLRIENRDVVEFKIRLRGKE